MSMDGIIPYVLGGGGGGGGSSAATVAAMISGTEDTATASQGYSVGEYFIYNDALYIVTSPISQGDTITPGTNCDTTTVCENLTDLNGAIKSKLGKRLDQCKYVLVGDSYSLGSVTGGTTWMSRFISDIGVPDANCLKFQLGAHGFYGGTPYLTGMQSTLDSLTDGDTYDFVIVCGGANDAGQTSANIQNAMSQFYTAMHTYFPNARCYCGFIAWTRTASQQSSFGAVQNVYYKWCNIIGVTYLQGCEAILHYRPWLQNTSGNYHHPTSAGSEQLGDAIVSAFLNGRCNFYQEGNSAINQTGTHLIPSTANKLYWEIKNEQLHIYSPLIIYGNTGGTETGTTEITQNAEILIGTMQDGAVFGQSGRPIYLYGTLYAGNQNIFVPMTLKIAEGNVYLINRGTTISVGFGGNLLFGEFTQPIMSA